MTVTIGRAGQAGYTLRNPSQMSLSGDRLQMSGTAKDLSSTTMLLLRDQFRGVSESVDEPVIPVVFSSDAALSGFYADVQVDFDVTPAGQAHGWVQWQMSGRRVESFGLPLCESRQMQAVRTNDLSITNVKPWWATPAGMTAGGFGDTSISRTGEDGSVLIGTYTTAGGLLTAAGSTSFSPAASRWYESAASFQVAYSGTLYRMCGRQIPAVTAGTAGAWAISTGVVRLSPSSTAGALLLEGFQSGAWKTLATVQVGPAGINAATKLISVTVSRNTPAVTVCRVGYLTAGIGSQPGSIGYLDIVARYGSTFFECNFGGSAPGFEFNGQTGSTSSSGMQRSADDTNSNRWFTFAAVGSTYTTASSADVSATTGSGLALGGLISGNGDSMARVRDQYFWTMTESVNFVTP